MSDDSRGGLVQPSAMGADHWMGTWPKGAGEAVLLWHREHLPRVSSEPGEVTGNPHTDTRRTR